MVAWPSVAHLLRAPVQLWIQMQLCSPVMNVCKKRGFVASLGSLLSAQLPSWQKGSPYICPGFSWGSTDLFFVVSGMMLSFGFRRKTMMLITPALRRGEQLVSLALLCLGQAHTQCAAHWDPLTSTQWFSGLFWCVGLPQHSCRAALCLGQTSQGPISP